MASPSMDQDQPISVAAPGYSGVHVNERHTIPLSSQGAGANNAIPNGSATVQRKGELSTSSRHRINLATAKGIPIFLALIVAFISYTITGPLAVEYLLNPPRDVPARIGAGIAIPIAYYLLLLPVAASYLRLLIVIWTDPGYVPFGSPQKTSLPDALNGLEDFWMRNVFACDHRGMPIWCSTCQNWKPDRTHHSQDAGRCTQKMDHFCPWVGGVVGERTYKFFVQFNFYSFVLAAYTMSVLAFFVAKRDEGSNREIQWLIALGLSAFFCLFTIGIFLNSIWMIARNVTSIENISSFHGTFLLAVLLPPELQGQHLQNPPLPPQAHVSSEVPTRRSGDSERPLTSDLNEPSHSTYFTNLQAPRLPRRSTLLPYQHQIWRGTVTYPLRLSTDRPPLPAPSPRTFAILETLPGMNPWDLDSRFRNLQAVFGTTLHDWLLPVKHSPCCDHSSLISQYPLGPDFEDLLIEAGLMPRPASMSVPSQHTPELGRRSPASRKRKRRKPRLDPGWQNGERPDGWMSEKEARRVRNEVRRSMYDTQNQV